MSIICSCSISNTSDMFVTAGLLLMDSMNWFYNLNKQAKIVPFHLYATP